MDTSALLRSIGIGLGISLLGGFTSAITANIIILILVPTIVAILCSIPKIRLSFTGYCIGFGITALFFALILDTITPGFAYYMSYFAVIFGFTLSPILYSSVLHHSPKNLNPQRTTTPGQGMQESPANVSEKPGLVTGQSHALLEELDKQSSLIYLCPYCNAEVKTTDEKCPICGATLDRRITKIN